MQHLSDNLNAEISLGTVTNVDEAVTWLSYTYLYVRMRKNPLVYGVTYAELRDDPELHGKRREIIVDAARSEIRICMHCQQYIHCLALVFILCLQSTGAQFNSDSENNSENPSEFLDMSKLKIFEFFI